MNNPKRREESTEPPDLAALSRIRRRVEDLKRVESGRTKPIANPGKEPLYEYSLGDKNTVNLLLEWDVAEARKHDCSWQQIAEAAGVSETEALERWEGVEDKLNRNNPQYTRFLVSWVAAIWDYPHAPRQKAKRTK